VDRHQHEGRLEAPETLWPDMAKGPTYLSVKNGAFSTSGMGHERISEMVCEMSASHPRVDVLSAARGGEGL
jgi:hypothetical protein